MPDPTSIGERARRFVADKAFVLRVMREAGALRPVRPDKALRMGATFARWGPSPATGIAVAAIHHPDAPAVSDERRTLTYEQLHRRSNALADGLEKLGVRAGDGVGIMCRNHAGFAEATFAVAKLGAAA